MKMVARSFWLLAKRNPVTKRRLRYRVKSSLKRQRNFESGLGPTVILQILDFLLSPADSARLSGIFRQVARLRLSIPLALTLLINIILPAIPPQTAIMPLGYPSLIVGRKSSANRLRSDLGQFGNSPGTGPRLLQCSHLIRAKNRLCHKAPFLKNYQTKAARRRFLSANTIAYLNYGCQIDNDFRPAAIIRDLNLLRPIYLQTAAYGHFGRTDIDLPWEKCDKVKALQKYQN